MDEGTATSYGKECRYNIPKFYPTMFCPKKFFCGELQYSQVDLYASSIVKMGQSWPLLIYFRPFLITIAIIQIEKSLGGMLGI